MELRVCVRHPDIYGQAMLAEGVRRRLSAINNDIAGY